MSGRAEANIGKLCNFKKAFDCIHRDSLWQIAAEYGVPAKVTNNIKASTKTASAR